MRVDKKIKIMSLSVTMLILSGHVVAQGMPVYDNTNFITLGKQIIESAKHTAELIKTVEFLKEQKERIEKVSNAIEQLKAIRQLVRNNERLYRTVRSDLRDILDSPYIKSEEVERVSRSFNAIIENSLSDLEFINEVLSSGHLKLTDAERMKVIREREQRSHEMVIEIERRTQRYRDIIAFREMQDRINNRETNY
jgi:hypothetical protein